MEHATECGCDACNAREAIIEQTDLSPEDLEDYSPQQLKALLIGLEAGLFEDEDGSDEDDNGQSKYAKTPWD